MHQPYSTASKYVHTWVSGMHQVLVPAFFYGLVNDK
jgi:hypothetical protein